MYIYLSHTLFVLYSGASVFLPLEQQLLLEDFSSINDKIKPKDEESEINEIILQVNDHKLKTDNFSRNRTAAKQESTRTAGNSESQHARANNSNKGTKRMLNVS
jgi:hypothetical protein